MFYAQTQNLVRCNVKWKKKNVRISPNHIDLPKRFTPGPLRNRPGEKCRMRLGVSIWETRFSGWEYRMSFRAIPGGARGKNVWVYRYGWEEFVGFLFHLVILTRVVSQQKREMPARHLLVFWTHICQREYILTFCGSFDILCSRFGFCYMHLCWCIVATSGSIS